ncbi:MAG: helix-turn-helix domain-containing protein [Acidiferrobacter sp.]
MNRSNPEEGRSVTRYSVQDTVATNLVIARSVNEMTQEALAEKAGLSRATIAQIESGEGDPRLSTLTDVASALGISPVLLLIGPQELSALADLGKEASTVSFDADQSVMDKMRRLVKSGLVRNRVKAAQIGATAAASAGFTTPGGIVGAALGSALTPGGLVGLAFGAVLGSLLARRTDPEEPEATGVRSKTNPKDGDDRPM